MDVRMLLDSSGEAVVEFGQKLCNQRIREFLLVILLGPHPFIIIFTAPASRTLDRSWNVEARNEFKSARPHVFEELW